MQVLVALTIGLLFWIAAWAFGYKAFDAFLVTLALVLGAAAVYVFGPYVRAALGQHPDQL